MIKAIKNLFKRKTEIEKLEDLRKDYLGKSFTTSKSNRSLSDAYVKTQKAPEEGRGAEFIQDMVNQQVEE